MRSLAYCVTLSIICVVCVSCSRKDESINELNNADFLQHQGKLEEAVAAYTKALEDQRNTYIRVTALYKRAYTRAQLKQYELALADADEALRDDPRSYMSHACRGNALDGLQQYSEAIKAYTRAIEFEPKDSRVFFNRAETYYTLGFTDLALKDFSTAIEVNPQQSAFYFYRGSVHFERGEYQETVADMERYLQMVQAALVEKGVYATYGAAQYFLGNYKQAEENFRAAAILYGKTRAQQSEAMGGLYLQVWDIGRALKYYDEAIALDSTNATFYSQRSATKYVGADDDGALADISRAIELGDHKADAYRWRGRLLSQKGSYELALKDVEQSISLEPNEGHGYFIMGDIAMFRGEKAGALDAYRRGLDHSRDKAELILRYIMLGGVLSDTDRNYLSQFSGKSWPHPLIRYFQGRVTREEVLGLAVHPNARIARAQESEAYFYIGARHLAKGETESARSYFQKAAECRHCFAPGEWFLAQKELETGFLGALLRTNAPIVQPMLQGVKR